MLKRTTVYGARKWKNRAELGSPRKNATASRHSLSKNFPKQESSLWIKMKNTASFTALTRRATTLSSGEGRDVGVD